MDQNTRIGPISRIVRDVLLSFRVTLDELTGDDKPSESKAIKISFENVTTRFKMWTGNLGAHQTGRASLDYRLRDASHLQEQIIYLLKDIFESLQNAHAILRNETAVLGGARRSSEDEDGSEVHKEILASRRNGEEPGDSESDWSSDDGAAEVSLDSLCYDVDESMDCLLLLSVAIANPAPHERFRQHGAEESEDLTFYEIHDTNHVREKFPGISPELATTLGKSITRRRQFFKYREAHHTRLKAGLDAFDFEPEGETSLTEIFPETIASSIPQQLKRPEDAEHERETVVIDEGGQSETQGSQTSYATSAGFWTDQIDENAQIPPPPLRVPPLPIAATEGAFECPFCYRMIYAENRAAWKRHVFGDLRPYTCLSSECSDSHTDFDRRHQWQRHILQHHTQAWPCPFECQLRFNSQAELKRHIDQRHLPTATTEQLGAFVTLTASQVQEEEDKHCPLCGHSISGSKSYVKHVGRHLEQLSLFALPSLELENADPTDDPERDSQQNLASESDNASSIADSTDDDSYVSTGLTKATQDQVPVAGPSQDLKAADSTGDDPIDVDAMPKHPDIPVESSKSSGVDEKAPTDRGESSSGLTKNKEVTSTEPKLRFKDAVGRKFAFPMHICATWPDMEHLIKQAFRDVDILGPHVMEGRYNLIGPDGEVIPPYNWEEVIQPGWIVTMRMWPLERLVDATTQTPEPGSLTKSF